ncbi:MAG: hypothetical protein JSC188_000844 [Candidatus Tokpelaia sp. JSC188]|nr:MAG: hypothetical protein JSC188_000844 [Candidatus Tokpelaia sp. JSC188]
MLNQQVNGDKKILLNIILGIGYTSKAQGEGIEGFIRMKMKELNIAKISALATLSRSILPTFLLNIAKNFGAVPIQHYTAIRLEMETLRLIQPSYTVYRAVGCHGVAEAAALCAAGKTGHLILEKTVFKGITFALACGSEI